MSERAPLSFLIAEYAGVEVIHPESELIERVAYNALRRRMRVTFASGRIVDFTETPDTVFRAFACSQAPDDFFEKRIRGQFAWCEVGSATVHE